MSVCTVVTAPPFHSNVLSWRNAAHAKSKLHNTTKISLIKTTSSINVSRISSLPKFIKKKNVNTKWNRSKQNTPVIIILLLLQLYDIATLNDEVIPTISVRACYSLVFTWGLADSNRKRKSRKSGRSNRRIVVIPCACVGSYGWSHECKIEHTYQVDSILLFSIRHVGEISSTPVLTDINRVSGTWPTWHTQSEMKREILNRKNISDCVLRNNTFLLCYSWSLRTVSVVLVLWRTAKWVWTAAAGLCLLRANWRSLLLAVLGEEQDTLMKLNEHSLKHTCFNQGN